MLDRLFQLEKHGTDSRREILAGTTTFLILIGIPLSYSISDGLALGFIAYPILKLASGRARELRWPMTGSAVVLLLYLVFLRGV